MSCISTSLIDVLRCRTKPLKISIDEYRCIVAHRYDFGGAFKVGVIFDHSEGPIVIGVDPPSRAEYRGLKDSEFKSLTYAEKKHVVNERFGFEEEEQYPWIIFNALGEKIPDTDTEARMMAWLTEPTEGKDDLNWVPRYLSEYLPGFEIMEALTVDVRTRLGLCEVDIGGMGSSGCWAVKVTASPSRFDAALRAAGLPFRLAKSSSKLPPARKTL